MSNEGQAVSRESIERIEAFVRENIDAGLQQFVHEPNNDATRAKVTATIKRFLRDMQESGDVPPEFFRVKAKASPEDVARGMINVYAVRNFAAYPMTSDEFVRAFGRVPEQDDLHRVNCAEEGTAGHYNCGWCMEHETARWSCGCLHPAARRPGACIATGPGLIPVAVPSGLLPMHLAGDVDEDRHIYSAEDASHALRDGAITKDQAMAISAAFYDASIRHVVVSRHVPPDTPPWRALVAEADVVEFVRARFPDVHECQCETVVDERRYVLTCTTPMADRETLTERIHDAIAPHGALGVAFEVRVIPVSGGVYR